MSGYNHDQRQNIRYGSNQLPPILGSTPDSSGDAPVKLGTMELNPFEKFPKDNEANGHFSNPDRRPSDPNSHGPPASYSASVQQSGRGRGHVYAAPTSYSALVHPSGHAREHPCGVPTAQAYQGVPYGYNSPYTQPGPATPQVFMPPQMTQHLHGQIHPQTYAGQQYPNVPGPAHDTSAPPQLHQGQLNVRFKNYTAENISKISSMSATHKWRCCVCLDAKRSPLNRGKGSYKCLTPHEEELPEGGKQCQHERCEECEEVR